MYTNIWGSTISVSEDPIFTSLPARFHPLDALRPAASGNSRLVFDFITPVCRKRSQVWHHNINYLYSQTSIHETLCSIPLCHSSSQRIPVPFGVLSGGCCLFGTIPVRTVTRDYLNGLFCGQQLHLKNVWGADWNAAVTSTGVERWATRAACVLWWQLH